MVENMIKQTSKKTMYKWSFYLNIMLFFVVVLFIALTAKDYLTYVHAKNSIIPLIQNLIVIMVALTLIFYQFFRNLFTIMKRSL